MPSFHCVRKQYANKHMQLRDDSFQKEHLCFELIIITLCIPIGRIRKIPTFVSVSCFVVRVSVMFHFMFVHYTFSSVWVAEWPPFGK